MSIKLKTNSGWDIIETGQEVHSVMSFSTVAGSKTSGSEKSVRWYVSGVEGIITPYNGMKLAVKIPLAGVATGGVILSINGDNDADYHPVAYNVNTVFTTHFGVNTIKYLTYDANQSMVCYKTAGTSVTVTGVWKFDADYDSNTTITYGTLAYYYRPYMAAYLSPYQLVVVDKDNRLVPLSTTQFPAYASTTTYAKDVYVYYSNVIYKSLQASNKNHTPNSSTTWWAAQTTPHTPTAAAFKPDKIYWYNTTTAISAGTAIGGNTLMSVGYNQPNMAICNFNSTISSYRMIYLRGTYDKTTGLFTLKNGGTAGTTNYYTLVPDNTANITLSSYFTSGDDYILLGATYSSNNYMHLREDHPMFHFDGTNLVPYDTYNENRIEGLIPTKTSDLTNDSGFLTGITSSQVTTALGYTPYNSTNPNGYITSSALSNYAVKNADNSFSTAQTFKDITLYNASGDSPRLTFQRGTLTDTYNDWSMYDSSGYLYIQQRGSGSSAWETRATFTQNGVSFAGSISENGTSLSSKYLGISSTAADSTKLNGQNASYYLNYNNFTNTPTIPSAITINTTNKTISDGTNTLTFGSNAFNSTTIPTSYLKSATVEGTTTTPNNTLTITDASDTAITFSPESVKLQDFVENQTADANNKTINLNLSPYNKAGIWYTVASATIAKMANSAGNVSSGECMLETRPLGSTAYTYQIFTYKSGTTFVIWQRVQNNTNNWGSWYPAPLSVPGNTAGTAISTDDTQYIASITTNGRNLYRTSFKGASSSTTWDSTSDVYLPTMKAIKNYVTGLGYTSNTGTITGVSVNGTSVATSGVAALTNIAKTNSANTFSSTQTFSGTITISDGVATGATITGGNYLTITNNLAGIQIIGSGETFQVGTSSNKWYFNVNGSTGSSGQVLTIDSNGKPNWATNSSGSNYYPSRSYSSGLQISTSQGVTNTCALYVPYATNNQAGVVSTSAQTFAGDKTINGSSNTPLVLKSTSSSCWIDFKNSSGTDLGSYGVNSSKQPVFYNGGDAMRIALYSDLPIYYSTINVEAETDAYLTDFYSIINGKYILSSQDWRFQVCDSSAGVYADDVFYAEIYVANDYVYGVMSYDVNGNYNNWPVVMPLSEIMIFTDYQMSSGEVNISMIVLGV